MGEVVPTQFRQAALPTGEDKSTPVVQVSFTLTPAVEEGLYEYLTRGG